MWPFFPKNPTPNKNREPINKPKDYEIRVTPQKTNMTMENQPFADVSPIKNGDFPVPC